MCNKGFWTLEHVDLGKSGPDWTEIPGPTWIGDRCELTPMFLGEDVSYSLLLHILSIKILSGDTGPALSLALPN